MAVVEQEHIGVTDARAKLTSVINSLQEELTDHVYLMRQNQAVAVILPANAYNRIRELEATCEHLEEALAIVEARLSDSGERHTLDQVLERHSITA